MYADRPHEFEFSRGDRTLISRLIGHVKKVFEQGNDNKYFQVVEPTDIIESQASVAPLNIPNTFLRKLVETLEKNSNRTRHGYRYDDDIKSIASYIRMLAGPLAYDTLAKNMIGALPSLQSTNRYIAKTHSNIIEGVVRSDELLEYLRQRNLPLRVCLSEDGTCITDKVQYDHRTNQLIGFTLPMEDGLPSPLAYPVNSLAEMVKHFSMDNSISTFANVVMAQPIGNAPPFCLLLFGSNNKYTAKDVANRWQTIKDELKTVGIHTDVYSSDSDPRYNSAMRFLTGLGKQSSIFDAEWFQCSDVLDDEPICFQDTTHIVTKLRNFFLRKGKIAFGNYFIEKEKNIEHSDGTVKFLQIIQYVAEAFLKVELNPLQRVNKIWYSVFILRIWRKYIEARPTYTLKDHFLTTNCMACIEINAHGLVQILLRLENKPNLFAPHIFDSQACEKSFRQMRSFSTVYSTVVNVSIKEMLNRLNKIQLQSDIANELSNSFAFPRMNINDKDYTITSLPSKKEIHDEIKKCKKLAIQEAIELGLIKPNKKNLKLPCPIKPIDLQKQPKPVPLTKSFHSIKIPSLKNIMLKDFSQKFEEKPIGPSSRFIEIIVSKKRVVVKKTSLCWMLRKDVHKLSSDRLQRVRGGSKLKKEIKKKTKPIFKKKVLHKLKTLY